MAYIRVKNIRGREYAYLVRTRWLKGKKQAKQSVSKYLGRVHGFSIVDNVGFLEHHETEDVTSYLDKKLGKKGDYTKGKEELVKDLIDWEFKRRGIADVKVQCKVAGRSKVQLDGKNISVKMNEGFLNGHTLRNLIQLKQKRIDEVGIDLAKGFVDAGIGIPKELFVEVFSRKIFK
ncbi:MAG: hypothetical protein QF632_00755 [Candidatus Woesearchaeota archaeon]|jgi:hypothetical protein|nr:hypothetical protein [Candidatus Woesearchaeota archaeon]MDP7323270.1 hypothetical protein [Candidatus Woesearchaeota archaeon]MDP7457775.1 hypothetical protein [Candidatus Woesearchaeota archaeon]|tara:strand:- start:101 stop:628 length:528 start_codon:yes stop_codon:yes gene_type:complete